MTDSTDNDYTDTLKTADDTQKTNVPPPACFQLCLQCMKLNQNPYYQYCFSCFAVSSRKYYYIYIYIIRV